MKRYSRRNFMQHATAAGVGLTLSGSTLLKASSRTEENIPVGIIGLDTSHSVAFSKYINSRQNGFQVTTAYTTVSKDIPSSYERVDKFTQEIKESGIRVVDSIKQVLEDTQFILLETNDGRLHLEQIFEVFESGKAVFLDKPVAAQFKDVAAIYRAAEDQGVPLFSSSGTRYMSQAQKVRNGLIGDVYGADTYSPVSYEPNHSDLYWYGIHGVELLFTVLKAGCKRVRRIRTDHYDTVTGEWHDGKIGTFRGILEGSKGYGGQAFGTEGLAYLGNWEGYDPLVESILEFFRTGQAPVEPRETLEIYAYMEAARMSTEQNGDWVDLEHLEF